MKLNVNANELKDALENLQVKGKYNSRGGLKSGSLEDIFFMSAKDGKINLWSGNNTFIVNISLDAEVESSGGYIGKSEGFISFLKRFDGDVRLEYGDYMVIKSEGRQASLPRIIEWPQMDAITRMGERLSEIPYALDPEKLPSFGRANFEGAFVLTSNQFSDVITSCELVKEGIYKIEFKENSLVFSSQMSTESKISQTVEPAFRTGDPATLEYSGPLHKFFKKDQLLTFYVLDDAPLVIIADDRRLVKAPHQGV